MDLITITEVSKNFSISTRTLRYYEQIGLLKSIKKDDYAYRTYDDETVKRLQQIIILRKLRIPLKQIFVILESENTAEIIDSFRQNLNEVDEEITALSTIRTILNTFIIRLNLSADVDINVNSSLFDDAAILDIADSLTVTKFNFKAETTMADLEKASVKINRLTDGDVRIIYLPPMTVASSHCMGEHCEKRAGDALQKFVNESGLLKIKPDTRHIGFNNPIQPPEDAGKASAGYEMWVSVPENIDVPSPIVKKRFHGGLYAAHAIKFGDFDHWGMLWDWVMASEKYTHDWGSLRCEPHAEGMDWCFEEQLNYYNNAQNPDFDVSQMQLDLLVPIKLK